MFTFAPSRKCAIFCSGAVLGGKMIRPLGRMTSVVP